MLDHFDISYVTFDDEGHVWKFMVTEVMAFSLKNQVHSDECSSNTGQRTCAARLFRAAT